MTFLDTPDWLGAPSLGSAVPLEKTPFVVPGGQSAQWGPLLVAPAQSLILTCTAGNTVPSTWSITWSTSPTGYDLAPSQQFWKVTGVPSQFNVPVIAPYITVNAFNPNAGAQSYALEIDASASATASAAINFPQILSAGAPTVAANTSQTILGTPQVAGPARLFMDAAVADVTVALQYWNGTAWGVYVFLTGPANSSIVEDVDLPITDWRLVLNNNDANPRTINYGLTLSG